MLPSQPRLKVVAVSPEAYVLLGSRIESCERSKLRLAV
jgi:hypothetical protein